MHKQSGRGSARLERTVRVREVGGSNPPAPTKFYGSPHSLFHSEAMRFLLLTKNPDP
jgi:hypothetical protein